MFDEYPDLFATRKDCYNFLFCTNGNGYEWKRGQVVECEDYDERIPDIIKAEEADYAKPRPKAYQTKENIRKMEEWRRKMKRLLPNEKLDWYPVCKYSLIKCVPMNVRPDWSEALVECKMMMEQDGIDVKIKYTDNESQGL